MLFLEFYRENDKIAKEFLSELMTILHTSEIGYYIDQEVQEDIIKFLQK